jgi:hypothetical protein
VTKKENNTAKIKTTKGANTMSKANIIGGGI